MALETAESSGEIIKEDLDKIFEHLVDKCEFLIRRLRDFVAFPTLSSDPSKKANIAEMANYFVEILKKFGLKSFILPMTFVSVKPDDPPLVLAQTEMDPAKRTVCFYGHFDVRPMTMQDYWHGDPFVLRSSNDGTLYYGKGTSVGKGPILCLINAIGAYRHLGIALPINIKLVLDPMGLSDEELTGKFIRKTSIEFFKNIDFVCMCVGHWFGNTKPSVSHGSRGLCYFSMEIEGGTKDLHSGGYGGLINEPMTDLVYMMNQLVDKRGTIKINDMYQDVVPVTKDEKDYYNTIQFVVRDFKLDIGAQELLANEDKPTLLANLWRMPSLSIHGIQGAFSQPRTRNVIPGKVTGKFSIHIVPNMTPSKVKKKVFGYLSKIWKTRKSTNRIRVQMTIGKQAWYTDPNDANCRAAVRAVTRVYEERPELVRESNRVRMANTLRRVTNASVIGIPVGKANDVGDSTAEKIDLINYIDGCKIFASYIHEIAKFSPMVVPKGKAFCSCKTTGISECICYMKSGLTLEEIEDEEDEASASLEGFVAVTSAEMGREKAEEPASTRFLTYSSRVEKKIQALRNVIADGEKIIGLKHAKETVDAEEQVEDGEIDSIRTLNAMQQEETSKGQPAAQGIQTLVGSDSGQYLLGRGDQGTQLFKQTNADSGIAAGTGKPKAKKIVSMAGGSTNLLDMQSPSPSLKALAGLPHKSGLTPTEVTVNVDSASFSLLPDDKGLGTDANLLQKEPSMSTSNIGGIQQGYVGKKPFSLKTMTSKQLESEPYGIISSLSALLYKRRAEKMESASVKSLPGSRVIGHSNMIPSTDLNLNRSSSKRDLKKSSHSKNLNKSKDDIDKDSSKLHQVFVTIDQPGPSPNEIERKKSQSSEKRIRPVSLSGQNLS